MKYKVICHRPRTQRFESSFDIVIKSLDTLDDAGTYIAKCRKVHKEMVEKGYPWEGGEFDEFQQQPNDSFFIALGSVPFRKFYRS